MILLLATPKYNKMSLDDYLLDNDLADDGCLGPREIKIEMGANEISGWRTIYSYTTKHVGHAAVFYS